MYFAYVIIATEVFQNNPDGWKMQENSRTLWPKCVGCVLFWQSEGCFVAEMAITDRRRDLSPWPYRCERYERKCLLEDKLLCLAACINRTSTSSFYRIRHKRNFMTITRKCAFRKILGTASAYSEASDCWNFFSAVFSDHDSNLY